MKLATFNARAESVDNRRRLQAQAVSHSSALPVRRPPAGWPDRRRRIAGRPDCPAPGCHLAHRCPLMSPVSRALSHETPPAGRGGRHWPKSENQPHAKLIAAKRLAINGFLRRLSLPASTLTSFDAARWLLPCRGHV